MKLKLKTKFWDEHTKDKTRNLVWAYGFLFLAVTLFGGNLWSVVLGGIGFLSTILVEVTYQRWVKKDETEV